MIEFNDTSCSVTQSTYDYYFGCRVSELNASSSTNSSSSLLCATTGALEDLPEPFNDGSYIIRKLDQYHILHLSYLTSLL